MMRMSTRCVGEARVCERSSYLTHILFHNKVICSPYHLKDYQNSSFARYVIIAMLVVFNKMFLIGFLCFNSLKNDCKLAIV